MNLALEMIVGFFQAHQLNCHVMKKLSPFFHVIALSSVQDRRDCQRRALVGNLEIVLVAGRVRIGDFQVAQLRWIFNFPARLKSDGLIELISDFRIMAGINMKQFVGN